MLERHQTFYTVRSNMPLPKASVLSGWIKTALVKRTSKRRNKVFRQCISCRRAQQTVALFNNPIIEQKHLNVFNAIKESSNRDRFAELRRWKDPRGQRRPLYHTNAPFYQHLEAIELTEILASDKWYTRAWTLRETLVSGGPLHLLIPYLDTLKVPLWMESMPQQLMVRETLLDSGIHLAIFDRLRSRAERGTSKEWSDLYDRGKAAQRTLNSVIADYKIGGEGNIQNRLESLLLLRVASWPLVVSRKNQILLPFLVIFVNTTFDSIPLAYEKRVTNFRCAHMFFPYSMEI